MMISYFYVIVHKATGVSKVGVFGVDIGQFYSNQVMYLKIKSENVFIRL